MIPRASLRSSAASADDALVRCGDAIEMPCRACKPPCDACNLLCHACNRPWYACNSPCNASAAKLDVAATFADVFEQPCGVFPSHAEAFEQHAGSSAVRTIAAATLADAFAAMFVDAVTPAAYLVMRRVAVAASPGWAAAVVFSAVAIADFCIYWCFGGGNRGSVRPAAISTLIKPFPAAPEAIFAAAERESGVIGLWKEVFDVRKAALDGRSVTPDGPSGAFDGREEALDGPSGASHVRGVAFEGCEEALDESNAASHAREAALDECDEALDGPTATVDECDRVFHVRDAAFDGRNVALPESNAVPNAGGITLHAANALFRGSNEGKNAVRPRWTEVTTPSPNSSR